MKCKHTATVVILVVFKPYLDPLRSGGTSGVGMNSMNLDYVFLDQVVLGWNGARPIGRNLACGACVMYLIGGGLKLVALQAAKCT